VDFFAVEAQRPDGRLPTDTDDFRLWSGVGRGIELYAAPCALVLTVDQSHRVSKPEGVLTSTIYLTRSGESRQARDDEVRCAAASPCGLLARDDTASVAVNDDEAVGVTRVDPASQIRAERPAAAGPTFTGGRNRSQRWKALPQPSGGWEA
jgi:hypothetical protein